MHSSGLIVGLGNPGPRYALTRHNMGFLVLDRLIYAHDLLTTEKVRLLTETRELVLWEWFSEEDKRPRHLLKPLTFMNRSGLAVEKIASGLHLSPEQLLVVHDEVDLPLGKIKFKFGGGLAGHNGLRSIAAEIGSRGFTRLRMGIDRPQDGGSLSDYVLSRFTETELPAVESSISSAVSALRLFCNKGMTRAFQEVNTS